MKELWEFKPGTRIIHNDKRGKVISNFLKRKDTLAIEYDDGSIGEAIFNKVKIEAYELSEKTFKEIYEDIKQTFEDKRNQIKAIQNEMIEIAETNGVPFYTEFGEVVETYIPESFKKKFPDHDIKELGRLTNGSVPIWYNQTGWQSSSGSC